MRDPLIIAVFIVGSILTHYLMYLFVKFKMDEGVIIQLFKGRPSGFSLTSEQIAFRAELTPSRAKKVCSKSKKLEQNSAGVDTWRLSYILKP